MGRSSRLGDALRLAEAAICLLAARVAIAVIPFAQLAPRPTPPRRPELTGPARAEARRQVRRAIYTLRRRLPDQTTCLHRALAAQWMLRRRGVGTTLYFGTARLGTQGLSTHAWLQDGDEGIVGYHTAQQDRYLIIARYPNSSTQGEPQ